MSIITFFLLSVAFTIIAINFYKKYKARHPNFPPGPPRLPIYGSYWYLLKENYYFTHKAVEKLSEKYKTKLIGMYLGDAPTIIPVSYEMVKEALTREEFIGRNDTFITRNRSFGELLGLFFIDGPKWKEQRRFCLRTLRDFGFGRRFEKSEELIETETRELIKLFTNDPTKMDLDICQEKGTILISEVFNGPVLNIILQMLVGQRFENRELRALASGILRFMQSGDTTGSAISITPWVRFIAPNFFGYPPLYEENQRILDFFEKIVEERSSHFLDSHFSDFLDVYLDELNSNGKSLDTRKQMMWSLIDILFPGPVTISPSLTYMFAYLITYPDIQNKMREEIHKVVGKCRLPNLNDRQNLPFTEAFIREVLRKQPVLPIATPRRCVKDTTLGGYAIPKDSFILPCQWTSNHDPDVWDEPYTFKPERFLDKNGKLLKKDCSFSFGGGKRVCIGETFSRQVLFSFLSSLVQQFTFKAVNKMPEIENKTYESIQHTPFSEPNVEYCRIYIEKSKYFNFIVTFSLLFVALLIIAINFYKNYKARHPNFPPGPPRLPVYGSYWYLLKENFYFTHKAVEKLSEKYKTKLLGLYLGKIPTIIPVSYEIVKEVLTREEFIGRYDMFIATCRTARELLGKHLCTSKFSAKLELSLFLGLVFVDGSNWKEQKRFCLRTLRDFGFGRRFEKSEELIEIEVKELISLFTRDPTEKDLDVCREKGKILFSHVFNGSVLNIILQIIVGQKFENREMRDMARGIIKFMQSGDTTGGAISITPWLRFIAPNTFGYRSVYDENQRMLEFFRQIVDKRSSEFLDSHFSDFLDAYLHKLNSEKTLVYTSFTKKQLMWSLIDIMFPVPVTISPSLTYMFAYLITYPDIQKKIRDEIHSVVGKSRLPNLNDRKDLPFTEAFIKEVLRKQPILPIATPRRCVKDTTLGGYAIPKDTYVLPCQWTSNHDPDIWDEPYTFNPERFLDENGKLLKKDYSFAFGGGKRVCIAETFSRHVLFLFLSGLVQQFTFKAVDKMPEIENKTCGFVVYMADFWAEAVLN
ncbi:hypothetical protein FQR65_LT02950 [Abscondita terminalis]|nr:hypothetical protein FQR65_LT02950 [Abscondita terminalis]